MKPRLYKSHGMWICFAFDCGMRKSAMGETLRDAYENWCFAYAPLVGAPKHPGAWIHTRSIG